MELDFTINCVEELKPTLFPSGETLVFVNSITQKPSRAGGWFLLFEFVDEQGNKIYDRINLGHSKPVVVDIAKKQMQSIGRAAGLTSFKDTDDLIDQKVIVRVEHEKHPDYGWQATIKRYLSEFSVENLEQDLPKEDAPF